MADLTTLEELAGETLGQLHGNGTWPIRTCYVAAFNSDLGPLSALSTFDNPWQLAASFIPPADTLFVLLFARDEDRYDSVFGVAADGERLFWVRSPEGEIKELEFADGKINSLLANLRMNLNRARHG